MKLTDRYEGTWLTDFNQYITKNLGESYLSVDSIADYYGISRR
ncbi:hypothetical protein OAF63_02615 [Saprospiraceae bacterium]|jgi:hypothetical protein|nr:hypothetical protein [Bacteroidota bacterium]MDB4727657.1 hypothetical protein [Saprospiraceae bacterium]MDF1866784.1 hypothetical protein [Saprospiraceae bacterium]